MQKLILIDAYAMIFRAFYGFIRAPRINSRGENTSAAFGFVTMLEDLLRTETPDFLAVAFDPKGGTFRHEAFPSYKAQREATPEGIKWAVPVIRRLLSAYGIACIEAPGYEADDLIGTIAHRVASPSLEVLMLTPDKDYAQLVAPSITMCRPGRGAEGMERLGVAEVCEKYALTRPSQVIDLLGLMGDAADNIPGCPGVGEKTAAKLIAQFGDIDTLLSHTAELKGALRKKVEENAQQIRDSRWLATIKTDVPFDFALQDFALRERDTAALIALFEELEFRTLIGRYLSPTATATPAPTTTAAEPDLFSQGMATPTALAPKSSTDAAAESTESANARPLTTLAEQPHSYTLVEGEASARALCEELLQADRIGFDTETTALSPLDARLVGMSFATAGGRAWYVAVPEDEAAATRIVEALRPLLESSRVEKVGQNLKYDFSVLLNYGVELRAPMFDTMLAHYLLQPEQRHNLDHLAETLLSYRCINIETLIGSGREQRNMRELSPSDICDYACEDADVALRLHAPLAAALEAKGLTPLFVETEMPLMPVLARMEHHGVRLDTAALGQIKASLSDRIEALEAEIYALAGAPFKITSSRQVGEVLFDQLQISAKAKKTRTGQYATSEEVLESLRDKHPIVAKILQHRGLKKLLSTYVEALPKLIHPTTGRVHGSFNQAVTATGRLSSSNPNLQNIPIRTDEGREIRRAFVPEEGSVFLSADYSQIELRIMAHLSQDPAMIADFQAGRDIHSATAARIFGKEVEAVTSQERRAAKTANFGIIYGISAFGLSERMGVSRSEAKELIESYFQTYPRVKEYMDESIEAARKAGYITTQFGRRRPLPDINSNTATVRGFAERNAINSPIQGTAADIIKRAMVVIDRRLREEGFAARMVLQVHDELNFTVPTAELAAVRQLVVEEMERAFAMRVPLVAECGTGCNWLEAH